MRLILALFAVSTLHSATTSKILTGDAYSATWGPYNDFSITWDYGTFLYEDVGPGVMSTAYYDNGSITLRDGQDVLYAATWRNIQDFWPALGPVLSTGTHYGQVSNGFAQTLGLGTDNYAVTGWFEFSNAFMTTGEVTWLMTIDTSTHTPEPATIGLVALSLLLLQTRLRPRNKV
jgi:hypothetical protein